VLQDAPLTKKGEQKRLNDTLMLWNTRDGPPFSNNETMAYNSEIAYFWETCHNKSRSLPSKFDLSKFKFEKLCHEQGSGKKTIVVIGNSHAYKSFIGTTQIFKPISKKIILIAEPACVPAIKEQQNIGLNNVSLKLFP
jgi:hypothetical protein